jgi:hypothetical protein
MKSMPCEFLSTLATKVANFDAAMLASLDLVSLARAVTQRSPEHALEYLESEVAVGRDPVVPIVAGLADGLGASRLDDRASKLALRDGASVKCFVLDFGPSKFWA